MEHDVEIITTYPIRNGRVAQCVPGGGYGAAIGFIFGGGGWGCKVIIRTADCEP
jgi:hypothetical protein